MLSVLAILAIIAGVMASLGLFVLLLAGAPNSSPQMLARLKAGLLATAIIGTALMTGAVWALVEGRPGLAALVGGFPAAFLIGLFIWLEVSR
ncbi:MAG: hypothetical protein AB7G11_06680 [Phycisphaerales bacterium]